jgi:hypothetical protein
VLVRAGHIPAQFAAAFPFLKVTFKPLEPLAAFFGPPAAAQHTHEHQLK